MGESYNGIGNGGRGRHRKIIGLIAVIGLIAIMDRYLEFANHLRDFAAANLLSESQTCLVKDAKKQV
jgi:hypothetical protein